MDIGYFLKLMTEKNASDMFLTTGAPVYIKVEGKLYPLGNTGLPAGMVKKIAYSLMDEGQVPNFERDLELNMALALAEAGRFRVNCIQAARRSRHGDPRDPQRHPFDRGTPAAAGTEGHHHGPARPGADRRLHGSGKSTTLAAMIDHRNTSTSGHILTIEDPIEYLHKHKKSIVNQREVGLDTPRLPQRAEERDA
jgi:twitching motility protein PilU